MPIATICSGLGRERYCRAVAAVKRFLEEPIWWVSGAWTARAALTWAGGYTGVISGTTSVLTKNPRR